MRRVVVRESEAMKQRGSITAMVAAAVLTAAVAVIPAQRAEAVACLPSDLSLTIAGTTYSPVGCADGLDQGRGPLSETSSLNGKLGTSFTYLDSSEGSATPTGLGGIALTVTAGSGNSGNWTLSWTDVAGAPNL